MPEDKKKYPHAGHRKRMRERYEQNGFNGWAEHEVLEFLLFDKIPRRDTNQIAHDILAKFGTMEKMLSASEEQLCEVKGVGAETAKYIKAQKKMYDYCLTKKKYDSRKLYSEPMFKKYLVDLFGEKNNEALYMVCLDGKDRIIRRDTVVEGNFESVSLDVGSMVRIAVNCEAAAIVLAHNHPSGIVTPSESDITATQVIMSAMRLVGVRLENHFIVADERCESMMNRYPFVKKGNNVHKKADV